MSALFAPCAQTAQPAHTALGGGLASVDERGRLFVFGTDGLLRVSDAAAVAATLREPPSTGPPAPGLRLFKPDPPLPFTPTALTVSPSGQHACVSGADGDVAAVAVLRLSAAGAAALHAPGGPPTPLPWLGAGEGRSPVALPAGVALRRALWHPASESHLLTLQSDGALRLYAVPHAAVQGAGGARLAREQELWLCPEAAPPPGSLQPPAPLSAPAADFAFWPAPPRAGWSHLALLLLFRDGSTRVMCPGPTPFGGHLPLAAVSMMRSGEGADALASDTQGDAVAWMADALPREAANGRPAGRASTAAASSALTRIVPHCLPGRAPALQGPLTDTSVESSSRLEGAASVSLALAGLPGSRGDAAVLCVADACGGLQLSVLLGAPQPCWTAAPARADRGADGMPKRTRASSLGAPGAPPDVLSMDAVAAPLERAPSAAGLSFLGFEQPPGRRLFAVSAGHAAVLTLTWLPSVVHALTGDASGMALPLARYETLRSAGLPLVAAALCPSSSGVSLAVADAAGAAELLHGEGEHDDEDEPVFGAPLGPLAPPSPLPAASPAAAAAAERDTAALAALFDGPSGTSLQPAGEAERSAPGDSAAAQASLAAAAAAIRTRYVAWAHRARSELDTRARRLGREGARQAEALAAVTNGMEAVQRRTAALSARAARADALHANLLERVALLQELTAAGVCAGSRGSSALAGELAAWREALPGLLGRLGDLRERSDAVPATSAPSVGAPPALLASHEERLRRTLAACSVQLSSNSEAARALGAALGGAD